MKKNKVTPIIRCLSCKYEGTAKKQDKGSLVVEMVLLAIFAISIVSGGAILDLLGLEVLRIIPVVLVGLVWLIYAIWRHSTIYYGCPKCRCEQVVTLRRTRL
jgi:hypothetical protein